MKSKHLFLSPLVGVISFATIFAQTERSDSLPRWHVAVALAARETWDSNIFLQDNIPDPSISRAASPRDASLVTAVSVAVALDGRVAPELNVAANYTPEASFYHAVPAENNVAHRASLSFDGNVAGAPWSFQNSLTAISGSEVGPTFGCPGGVPAVGGIPLRDRRQASIFRSGFKLTQPFGSWFVRPVATVYLHDFSTEQSRRTGYENYIDRQEWSGGAEAGCELFAKTRLVAGFRYGRQDQLKLHGVDSAYDSLFRRFVAGIEGTPASWLQLNLLAGPETRSFASGTPTGFERNRVLLWVDGSAVVTTGARNMITFGMRRFEQPAFSSASVYEDITYEIAWRHKLHDRLNTAVGFKAYRGDWPAPVVRSDWVLTPSVALRYAATRSCTAELAYAFDRAESGVPNTAGREYRRELGSLSVKFAR